MGCQIDEVRERHALRGSPNRSTHSHSPLRRIRPCRPLMRQHSFCGPPTLNFRPSLTQLFLGSCDFSSLLSTSVPLFPLLITLRTSFHHFLRRPLSISAKEREHHREGWKKFEVASVFVQQRDGINDANPSQDQEEDMEYRVQK